jgi:hypothetical protein
MGKEKHIAIFAEQPEYPSVEYYQSGFKGGDAGHGGEAYVSFTFEGGDYAVSLETESGELDLINQMQRVEKVTIHGFGDWEQIGIATALIKLGKAMLSDADLTEQSGEN